MTKQEIITLLIKDYEEAIDKCKGMRYEDILFFLDCNGLEYGICHASAYKYKEDIEFEDWVQKHNVLHGSYWTDPPMDLEDKESIIQSLQTRLSILKTELEIPE